MLVVNCDGGNDVIRSLVIRRREVNEAGGMMMPRAYEATGSLRRASQRCIIKTRSVRLVQTIKA